MSQLDEQLHALATQVDRYRQTRGKEGLTEIDSIKSMVKTKTKRQEKIE
jgi:hypothetical protein